MLLLLLLLLSLPNTMFLRKQSHSAVRRNTDPVYSTTPRRLLIKLHFQWIVENTRAADFLIYIMVMELSGVLFGLRSYTRFQNRTSARHEFDLKSRVWFQTKNYTTLSSITTLLQPFWNRRIQSVLIFYWSSSRFVEKRKQKGFYISFYIRNRNDAI